MSSGPAASPSSQMVTRRTEADLEDCPERERSRPMSEARGTTEMQVKVLWGGQHGAFSRIAMFVFLGIA